MITFCALVYYKHLIKKLNLISACDIAQLIRSKSKTSQVHAEDKNQTVDEKKTVGETEEKIFKELLKKQRAAKKYNIKIVNKWHLMVTLINNRDLIIYRNSVKSFQKRNFQ
jgi:formate-dependent nitrite reductase cytochrome c552 subunit